MNQLVNTPSTQTGQQEGLLLNCDTSIFIHIQTLQCAIKPCIPCLYKIFPNGTARLPPNQRPETCPRSSNTTSSTIEQSQLFSPRGSILTVGDGDFSFSLSLAEMRQRNITRVSSGNTFNFFATSHESLKTVLSTYPGAKETLNTLNRLGVEVYHEIDATSLKNYNWIHPFKKNFQTIIWNFPCIRSDRGADAQFQEIEDNRSLLTRFFSNIGDFLLDPTDEERIGGRVYVTHKTIEPFCWWRIIDIASECGLHYNGSIVFDRCLFPGYRNRKALDKKSFPCHDARIFVFSKHFFSEEAFTEDMAIRNCFPLQTPGLQSQLEEAVSRLNEGKSDFKREFRKRKRNK